MHPDWMSWLKKESLFHVEVELLIRFHNMPRSRRCRTRKFWDEYEECRAKGRWADMSPVIGCTQHVIGCANCLSHRQAIAVSGEDLWCPQKTNADSDETCFWGEDGIHGGLCEDCFRRKEFGCGWGSHECTLCITDNHSFEVIVRQCTHCGPCPAMHGNEEDWPHCRQVCPHTVGIDSGICG